MEEERRKGKRIQKYESEEVLEGIENGGREGEVLRKKKGRRKEGNKGRERWGCGGR